MTARGERIRWRGRWVRRAVRGPRIEASGKVWARAWVGGADRILVALGDNGEWRIAKAVEIVAALENAEATR